MSSYLEFVFVVVTSLVVSSFVAATLNLNRTRRLYQSATEFAQLDAATQAAVAPEPRLPGPVVGDPIFTLDVRLVDGTPMQKLDVDVRADAWMVVEVLRDLADVVESAAVLKQRGDVK